jgi:hypothetical protein
MNHSEAIESQALASYLLDDLSEDDRTAFETHYIDCATCAEAVYTGTVMFAAANRIKNEVPVPVSVPQLPPPLLFPQRVKQWMSMAAAAALAFTLGAVGPWFQPQVASIPLMVVADPGGAATGVMRGTEPEPIVIHFQGDRQVEIYINNVPPKPRYPAYEVELLDASGKLLVAEKLTPKQALHPDGVPVLLRALPAGRYVLNVRGVLTDGNRPELVEQSVVVQ